MKYTFCTRKQMFPKLFTQKSKPDIRSKTLPSTEYKYFAKNYFQMRKPS